MHIVTFISRTDEKILSTIMVNTKICHIGIFLANAQLSGAREPPVDLIVSISIMQYQISGIRAMSYAKLPSIFANAFAYADAFFLVVMADLNGIAERAGGGRPPLHLSSINPFDAQKITEEVHSKIFPPLGAWWLPRHLGNGFWEVPNVDATPSVIPCYVLLNDIDSCSVKCPSAMMTSDKRQAQGEELRSRARMPIH